MSCIVVSPSYLIFEKITAFDVKDLEFPASVPEQARVPVSILDSR